MATTRLPLDRVPPEHAAWKPRPKSMSLGELAWHPADILFRVQATIQAEPFDDAHREALPSVRPRSPPVKRRSGGSNRTYPGQECRFRHGRCCVDETLTSFITGGSSPVTFG
jgi:hypothetical protein